MKLRYPLLSSVLAGLLAAAPAWANPAAEAAHFSADSAKAQGIAGGVCAGCHGMDGNSAVPSNPTLAGQHPEYIAKQLTEFKSGIRKSAVMSGMAASLSPDDMKNLGAYYGSQTPKPGKAKEPGLVAFGQKLYRGGNQASGVPACSSCHSPNGAGIPTQFPRLAGQHADYTLAQLKAFRTGDRDNDAAKMMRVIASKMTEQEIQAVSDYIAGLH
jgi:cytochrome c553